MPEPTIEIVSVANAIADNIVVDWQEAQRSAVSPTNCALIQQLKIIAIIAAHSSRTEGSADRPVNSGPMPVATSASGGLGAIKALMATLSGAFHLIIPKKVQHAAARYAAWLFAVCPISYVLFHTYLRRHQTVANVLGGEHWKILLLLALIGFLALTFRGQLLTAVDRWFFLRPTDHVEALARLEHSFQSASSIRDVVGVLAREIDRFVHPKAIAVLIANEDESQLVSLSMAVRPLSANAMLVEILREARTDILLDAGGAGPVARLLPVSDRLWLAEHRFTYLSPLLGSAGKLIGVVALAGGRSGLPYTRQNRAFITAMSGEAALKLENQLLLALPGRGPVHTDDARINPLDWSNEPGVYCPQCSKVWPTRTVVCPCGTETVLAALPSILNGRFRVERLIRAGGMGVVYQALDLALDRRVAIKALRLPTPDYHKPLQSEARAMASVLHPNLAMLFGLEHWRGTPLLIVEYLEGGTLADRLRKGPLTVRAVIDLGVVMADALDRLHASGVLHRDIKPSNIAYTREGIPKLLDFGLAAMLDQSRPAERFPTAPGGEGFHLTDSMYGWAPGTILTLAGQIIGTPLYLAPEAVRREQPRPSFDLWSLSLVLYEAIAGRLPISGKTVGEVFAAIGHFNAPDVRKFRPDCPVGVAALLESALHQSPFRRPATASDLRDRLQRLRVELISPNTTVGTGPVRNLK